MFQKLSETPIADYQKEQAEKWEDENLLQKCVEGREGSPRFMFYEGPPTANGKPGIHHVISRTLKDSVNRHKSMQGYQVPRKAGWDTHGLPVEIEVEKQLGLHTKKEIEEYGIAEFNAKCRESVFTYESMWQDMSRRMGFMVDFEKPYITLANDYIETGWYILKEFFNKEMIYEGHKILPYCPRCGTGLASHEVSLGYKEVKTNTVIAKFKRVDKDEYFLAWTTTPWTLPSNVSLTVSPDYDYVKVRIHDAEESGENPSDIVKNHGNDLVWVAKALADKVIGKGDYEVIEECKGAALENVKYEQLMPFVDTTTAFPGRDAFFITVNDYVTIEDGTGIVHTAPAFGEDDYNTGRKYNLPVPNPVDEEGKFTETPWSGHFVMEDGLDIEIIKWMSAEGKLFSKEKVEHNYPFCWRCDTPLIYYSKPSWYIEMTKLKDQLVKNNSEVNWFPDFVGEKRFGNWLENVNDWAISRSRYWGTPIPIWRCPDCGELECIGSRKELQEKAIETIADNEKGVPDIEMHRPYVDDIHMKCSKCGGTMNRIPEVMDCWFDSGSMPFAQQHWPFENEDQFDDKLFPADFICEGIDQTRGWFYSLMAISTFIKGTSPYKNCLVNDLILDKHGKKMSKSKGNTVDPFKLFDEYGADATRWYLLSTSPAWSPTKFDEEGLKEVSGKFFGTLRNIYHFFVLYSNQDEINIDECAVDYKDRPELDRWIISKYNNLIADVIADMNVYDHMKAVRKIQNFTIEELSNWYIRRARRRFWESELTDDKKSVYATTYEILVGLAQLMAPVAPFISDEIYTKLTGADNVHLSLYPEANIDLTDAALEEKMDIVRTLVGLGRGVREKERIKVRQPLFNILVDNKYEETISEMSNLIKEELNIKDVTFIDDLTQYMNLSLKPNFKVAGSKLGARMKEFAASIGKAESSPLLNAIDALPEGSDMTLLYSLTKNAIVSEDDGSDCIEIEKNFVDVQINAKEGFAVAMERDIFAILDTTLTPELIAEGNAREFVSKVQQLRKQTGLEMMDEIHISYFGSDEINAAVEAFRDHIMKETLALTLKQEGKEDAEKYNLNGHDTSISIIKA